MSTAISHRLSFDPHATIRERLICSTPELSEKIFALRASFQNRINRSPAGLWPTKTALEESFWRKQRALLKEGKIVNYRICVEWSMMAVVEVEAKSLDEAIAKVESDTGSPLPDGGYVESSFSVNHDFTVEENQ